MTTCTKHGELHGWAELFVWGWIAFLVIFIVSLAVYYAINGFSGPR